MKIKFEVRLTASKGLLAVLAALVGLQADKNQIAAQELADESQKLDPPAELVKTETVAESVPENVPVPKTRTRTRQTPPPAEKPIPEKIVAPAPEPEPTVEEAETEEETDPANNAPALTVDDIRNYAGKLIQGNPALRDNVMKILSDKGASKFSEAKPEDYPSILAEFKKLG